MCVLREKPLFKEKLEQLFSPLENIYKRIILLQLVTAHRVASCALPGRVR